MKQEQKLNRAIKNLAVDHRDVAKALETFNDKRSKKRPKQLAKADKAISAYKAKLKKFQGKIVKLNKKVAAKKK